MRDVFAQKKLSPALQLCIQSTRFILSIQEPELTDDSFRALLLDHADEVLARFQALGPQDVSDWSHEQLCCLMDDADYDPAVAARESESGLFLDLHATLAKLRERLLQEHQANKRLLPTATFLVAVDGSRQSYLAFEVATRLWRQGQLAIITIDDAFSTSRQLPQVSSDFIQEEYKAHCARLQLPMSRLSIRCEASAPSAAAQSVAKQLLQVAERESVDFLVLGAVGKGGPAVDQVRHVPREVVSLSTSIPTLVVPAAPVNSVLSRRYVFVVAVDKSTSARRCLNAALKLMRPVDELRIVHFYEKPVVGEFDKQPFAYYREVIEAAQVDGAVDIKSVESTSTVAESLQDYVAAHAASYLILGLTGDGEGEDGGDQNDKDTQSTTVVLDDNEPVAQQCTEPRLGRLAAAMLFSPRCALCLCP